MKRGVVAMFSLLELGGSLAMADPTPTGLPDFIRLWDFDHPDQAHPLFRQAWDLACATREENLAVDAAHMVAIVEPRDSTLV